MNDDQAEFIDNRHGMDIVLKARQKGFTTVIQLDMLDDCLFIPNTGAGVIAHNLNDAKAFFADKIKFAYDKLPQEFRDIVSAQQDAADSMKFSNGSSIRVGTSLRSGTLQRLHVSEYGKLCAKYPEKAKEVKSGAFNTVQAGQRIVVESTAEGQAGHFYQLTQEAQKKQDAGTPLTALDFKFHFAPWWTAAEYVLHEPVTITSEFQEYFDKLEAEDGIHLRPEQRAWYVKKAEQQGDEMKREYPSTPKEAFEASIEGAYFASEMRRVRKEGRICRIPIMDAPVYTTWDLGLNDSMTITFWQDHGLERRAIDYYENSGEGFGHYAAILNRKGYNYSRHYMPHDADQRSLTDVAEPRRVHAERAGIRPIDVLKRIETEQAGIDASRAFLSSVWFDEVRCARLIACMDNYRKAWDDKQGVFKSYALHDEFSHGYKSFESAAVMERAKPSRKIEYRSRNLAPA
ncbi:terminase [Sphingomonas melonis]